MKYAIIINLFILSIVVIGSAFFIRSALVSPSPTSNTTSTKKTSEEKYLYKSEKVSIEMEYPIIYGSSGGARQANEFLKQEIVREAEEFKKAEADNNIGIEKNGDSMPSYLIGTHEVPERNSRYSVILYNVEGYSRGAAHPYHFSKSYIFDYKYDKLMPIADMFKPESDYLEMLSVLSREHLAALPDAENLFEREMVEEGTKPEEKNFDVVLPLKDGLAVYFREYQVAPYAAGPKWVLIPYSKIRDSINPDGLLSMYIH